MFVKNIAPIRRSFNKVGHRKRESLDCKRGTSVLATVIDPLSIT